jgi:hypothetical protein
MLEWKFRTHRS